MDEETIREATSSISQPAGNRGSESQFGEMHPVIDRVLIIESPRAAALGLRRLVQERDDLELVAVAVSGSAAISLLDQVDPDIVLAPGDVAGVGIVELAAVLRENRPERKIGIFVSMEELDYDMEDALGHIPVDSYLLWDTVSAQSLDVCIRAYRVNVIVTCKRAAAELFTGPEKRQQAQVESLHLREHERGVLHRLADGLSQERIAEVEGLPPRTEQYIEAKLRDKLHAETRWELRGKARQLGFGTSSPIV